jgi:hypothetical protein
MAKNGDQKPSKPGVSADHGSMAAGRDISVNARSSSKRSKRSTSLPANILAIGVSMAPPAGAVSTPMDLLSARFACFDSARPDVAGFRRAGLEVER